MSPETEAPPRRGLLITLEGGEGAGKSTQARLLAEGLARAGHEVVLTREPGGTPEAEALREMLLRGRMNWSGRAETLLHFAARADHVDKVILPAMERGITVVCDRFFDSTMAYQGCGQHVDRVFIRSLIDLIGIRPDLTVILDLSPGAGFGRVAGRGLPLFEQEAAAASSKPIPAGTAAIEPDRYEALGEAFFERVRAGFRAIAEAEPERCVLIDAGGPIEAVQAAIRGALGLRLGLAP